MKQKVEKTQRKEGDTFGQARLTDDREELQPLHK